LSVAVNFNQLMMQTAIDMCVCVCVCVCIVNQVNIAGTVMGSTVQSLTPGTDKKFFCSP